MRLGHFDYKFPYVILLKLVVSGSYLWFIVKWNATEQIKRNNQSENSCMIKVTKPNHSEVFTMAVIIKDTTSARSFKHLSLVERSIIFALKNEGHSLRNIANGLGDMSVRSHVKLLAVQLPSAAQTGRLMKPIFQKQDNVFMKKIAPVTDLPASCI